MKDKIVFTCKSSVKLSQWDLKKEILPVTSDAGSFFVFNILNRLKKPIKNLPMDRVLLVYRINRSC